LRQTYLLVSGWQASALHHQLLRGTLEARIKATKARIEALEKAETMIDAPTGSESLFKLDRVRKTMGNDCHPRGDPRH